MDYSYSRQNRLITKQDFALVFAKPLKTAQHCFLALCRSNDSLQPRLGIIIKKSVIKQAIKRVRLRRIIRESFRAHKELLKGLDIIVLVRSECSPQNKILREMVDKLWHAVKAKQYASPC